MVAQAPVGVPPVKAWAARAHAQARRKCGARELCFAWMVRTVARAPHWPGFGDSAPVQMHEVPQPKLEPPELSADAVSRLAQSFQPGPTLDHELALKLADRRPDGLASQSKSSAAFVAG